MMVMEGMLAAMIGLVGALLSALLIWIRSDIKAQRVEMNSALEGMRATLTEHGERLARIETTLGAPASSPETAAAEAVVTP